MTSLAKIRANQRNARKSTGPRSRRGKAVAARNAVRHGLTVPVLADPALAPEVVALARTIARSVTGAEADAGGHALACRIAEADIDVRRVRAVKLRLFAALEADPGNRALLRRLASLDWYEGRAFTRRMTAVRAFDAARLPAPPPRKRSQHRKPNDFRGWRGVMRYARGLLPAPPTAAVARIGRSDMPGRKLPDFGAARLDPGYPAYGWAHMLRPLRERSQRRNRSDINTQPGPRRPSGKSCVPPRDRIGSPLMARSAAARPRVSNHAPSPIPPEASSEQTPHGEVET